MEKQIKEISIVYADNTARIISVTDAGEVVDLNPFINKEEPQSAPVEEVPKEIEVEATDVVAPVEEAVE